jgi:phosphocarrier protein
MISRKITVTNPMGVHARPSSLIVRTAMKFNSAITIVKDGCRADAKSIMSIMMLAATHGTVLDLITDGPDEKEAWDAINTLFVDNFSEGY